MPRSTFTGRRCSRRVANAEHFLRVAGAGPPGGVVRLITGRGRAGGGAPIRTRVRTLLRRLKAANDVVERLRAGRLRRKLPGAAGRLSDRSRPQASRTRPSTRLTDAIFWPRSMRQVSRSIRPWRTHCIIHCEPCTVASTRP